MDNEEAGYGKGVLVSGVKESMSKEHTSAEKADLPGTVEVICTPSLTAELST
jgi:hypothetical protein